MNTGGQHAQEAHADGSGGNGTRRRLASEEQEQEQIRPTRGEIDGPARGVRRVPGG
jgi:hypothetical protein